MSDRNWRELVFIYGMFTTILWQIILLTAMLFYAGGTIIWPGNSGYSFNYNFIGDLGLNPAHSGKPNTISSMLFLTGAILGTLSLIAFAIAYPYFFTESKLDKRLSMIASIYFIIIQIMWLFVFSVYNDIESYIDLITIFVLFGTLGFIIIPLWAIALFHDKELPNRIGVVWLIPYVLFWITFIAGLLTVGTVVEPSADYTALERLQFWAVRGHILLYVRAVVNFYMSYNFWKKAKS